MAGNKRDTLVDIQLDGKDDSFNATNLFGKNFEQNIRDPSKQQEHERFIKAENPASKIEFENFNLSSEPAYKLPPAPQSQNAVNSPPEVPHYESENLGFGDDPVPPSQTQPQQPQKPAHFWSIDYYKFLFDVDTKQVLHRVLRSLVPFPPRFFYIIESNPDLYGPFWIASTLVFIMSAAGNVANYVNSVKNNTTDQWTYDVNKLSYASGAVYGYLLLLPLVLWGFSKWTKMGLKFMNIMCIYGYSLFIYIPVSIVCIVPITAVRWGTIGLAALLSTSLLICNFFPVFRPQLGKGSILLLIMAAFHLGFALASELYFFNYS